ncbi:MAG: hypothetical protein G01um101470_19 [Parcubacteria group bacterium Gr01-1014_70]|nr:MAG: hypothetical protein G01um101470_19 [Parcubacteria group bacterium Gr01-1014_70]
MDNDLPIALKNLEEDDISVKVEQSGKGDFYVIILSKKYFTRIGCNDLGVWLVKQEKRNN